MFKVKSFDGIQPNPLFYRKNYEILDGSWNFYMDFKNKGEKNKFYESFPVGSIIQVPCAYVSKSSGIENDERCDNVWYMRTIHIADLRERYFLVFEGADYITKLWVNKKYVGENEGCYHRFSFDITDYLNIGDNEITVKCSDDYRLTIPRGKQRFLHKNYMCWYDESTGIYKTVWLERRPKEYIESFKFIPSYKNQSIKVDISCTGAIRSLKVNVSYKDIPVYSANYQSTDNHLSFDIDLRNEFHPWDVLKPELYDIEFIYNEKDDVLSYFGLRDIYTVNDKIYLNDHELYEKLVLDQGYSAFGHLTLSNDECLNDITNMISMGFNGARKHQKKEAEMFYSYADFLGYLTWFEMPSMYLLTRKSGKRLKNEWMKMLQDAINHASIITYVPFNESWGIWGINKAKKKTVSYVNDIIESTKEYDSTRPVISNDGWCHVNSDIITIHLYPQDKNELKALLDKAIINNEIDTLGKKKLYHAMQDRNKPLILSEFGGTSYIEEGEQWGYGKNVKSYSEYKERLTSLFDVVLSDKRLSGYCYTQLSDVKQEKNGLYTLDRKEKIKKEDMKEIQSGK